MQSLIEQVKRLVEAQKKADVATGKVAPDLTEADAAALDSYWAEVVKLDFPTLLAHMQAQQAVVDAARSVLTALGVDDVPYTGLKRSLAALEKESNGK